MQPICLFHLCGMLPPAFEIHMGLRNIIVLIIYVVTTCMYIVLCCPTYWHSAAVIFAFLPVNESLLSRHVHDTHLIETKGTLIRF